MHDNIENKYTQQYKDFKEIPEHCRDDYRKMVVKKPMENTDLKELKGDATRFESIKINEFGEDIDLAIYLWETKNQPKGILFFAHGLNGHGNNMGYLMKQASQMLGLVGVSMDYRNFGRTGGTHRGLINDPMNLVADIEKVLVWSRDQFGENLPIFLLGLSMGGLISLHVANRNLIQNIKGVIFLSPALRSNKQNPLPLKFIHYLKIIFAPRSYLFEPSYTSSFRHKLFTAKIKADQYIYQGCMRAGTIRNMGSALKGAWKEVVKFKLPYLFVQSGSDKVVDPFAIVDFDRDCQSDDKTHFFAKDMWHTCCFDRDFEEMVPEIIRWLKVRLI